jgi:hypothetical protein
MIRWLIVLAILIGACGSPDRPGQANLVLPPGPPLTGAVLGATREEWVAARGEPVASGDLERFNDVEVAWTEGEQHARRAELMFEGEQPVGEARERAKYLLPRDAKPVRTASGPGGQSVEIYTSQALGDALGVGPFGSEPPGTFTLVADRGSGRTNRVVIEVGNRP